CDLGTRRVREITAGDFDAADPAWSPDGSRLAFVANRRRDADRDRAHADVFVVARGGGRARALTAFRGPKRGPAWSPDGRTIAFLAPNSFPDAIENLHVWLVAARGGAARDAMPNADLMCGDALVTDIDDSDAQPAPFWSRR